MDRVADRPRATRYDVAADLMYRPVGEDAWCAGRTVNVSRTGVLFQSASALPFPAARIEFVLVLPGLGPPGRAQVLCAGRVVRRAGETADACVAATIEAYEFLGTAPGAGP